MNEAVEYSAMTTARRFLTVVLPLVGAAVFLSACGGSGSSPALDEEPPLLDVTPSGSNRASQSLRDLVFSLPYEDLSAVELAAIDLMREEEKLARDVYLDLYDTWGMQIFDNISQSEQTHMDAVLLLIEKYDLDDPAYDAQRGEFFDATLQGLFDSLVAQGTGSTLDALVVGATIEDLDIYDLQRLMADTDNEDVAAVFESLQKGSRNHLRAFHARLLDQNFIYTPIYISQDEYDEIVNSPMERG